MSWKMVLIEESGNECGNACRFATYEEAKASYQELYRRWTLCPRAFTVRESDDPVNYTMAADGRLVRLEAD